MLKKKPLTDLLKVAFTHMWLNLTAMKNELI